MSYRRPGLGAPTTPYSATMFSPQTSAALTAMRTQNLLARRPGLVPAPPPPPPPDEAPSPDEAPLEQPVVDTSTLLAPLPTEIPWMWIGVGAGALVVAGGAWWWWSSKKKVSANRRRTRRARRRAA
jgi:hypothetical protein